MTGQQRFVALINQNPNMPKTPYRESFFTLMDKTGRVHFQKMYWRFQMDQDGSNRTVKFGFPPIDYDFIILHCYYTEEAESDDITLHTLIPFLNELELYIYRIHFVVYSTYTQDCITPDRFPEHMFRKGADGLVFHR